MRNGLSASDVNRAESRETPLPVRVRYNDWHRVPVPALADFTPSLPVSVIIPYYESPEKLALCLAALEGQTYPRELFEVVVVDDGSRTPLEAPRSTPLDVRVAHQEDRGFGEGRARNLGVRLARHDILVFLDCDMLAEAWLLAAHARWHHVLADAVTLGWRRHIPADSPLDARRVRERAGSIGELIASRGIEQEEAWSEAFMRQTHEMQHWTPQLYWMVASGNFGIRRRLYEFAGDMLESFRIRTRGDTEFGYRAFAAGGLLVPDREAMAWHLGLEGDGEEAKNRENAFQHSALIHLLPQDAPNDWRAPPGRVFKVPRYVVTLRAERVPVERALATAEKLLAGREYDLVVRIETDAAGDELAWLQHQLGPDPRARISPAGDALREFPFVAFHIALPTDLDYVDDVVDRLRRRLGPLAVTAQAALPGGRQASIARGWALHRARRTGLPVTEFGERVSLPSHELVASRASASGKAAEVAARPRRRPVPRRAGRRCRKVAARVADLARRWSLSSRSFTGSAYRAPIFRRDGTLAENGAAGRSAPPVEGALGAEIVTLGPRARAVFAASMRVARELRTGAHADMVLADTRAQAAGAGAPVVILPDAPPHLSVPAFDPRLDNPVNWRYRVGDEVGALGPVECLPRGVEAHRALPPRPAKAAFQGVHHIEDVAAYHADASARAGELARLAANGAVVHLADGGPGLEPLLGEELHALMTGEVRDLDLDAREWLSVRMRRLALRDHSLQARARQLCELALPDPPRPPLVSILLPTRRPEFLGHALSSVARQTWPRCELVLGLHGDGFDAPEVERRTRALKCPVKVVRMEESRVSGYGALLNRMTEAADGAFLAKMDDDDLYDAEHVQDLMLAHEYSGASLVGRTIQFIYLAGSDKTLRWRKLGNEGYRHQGLIAGGAVLLARRTLDDIGGWWNTPFGVDLLLLREFESRGVPIYRTHGAGFVLVRGGAEHTWTKEDADFRKEAAVVHDGWTPGLVCMDGGISPPGVAGGVAR